MSGIEDLNLDDLLGGHGNIEDLLKAITAAIEALEGREYESHDSDIEHEMLSSAYLVVPLDNLLSDLTLAEQMNDYSQRQGTRGEDWAVQEELDGMPALLVGKPERHVVHHFVLMCNN